MSFKALHNQSVLDVLLQQTGSIAGILAFCQENGISLTDELQAGANYNVPEGITEDTDIKNYYSRNGYVPATSLKSIPGDIITDYGIGEMIIGNSFIVR